MSRVTVLAVVLALVLGAVSGLRTPAAGSIASPASEAACEYYHLRARPEPREQPLSFADFLAETCVAARRSLDTGASDQQAAALRLLDRIGELHSMVTEMNADRDAAVAGLTGVTRMLRLTRVTPTGEFLIAHRMGLLREFEAWLDTGADFSLALYR